MRKPEFYRGQYQAGGSEERGFSLPALIKKLMEQDPTYLSLWNAKNQLVQDRAAAQDALHNDPLTELPPSNNELSGNFTSYPVSISADGAILCRNNEDSGAVQLTGGDLLAAAEWGMLPTVDRNMMATQNPLQIRALGAILEVEYIARMQRLDALSKFRNRQFIDTADSLRRKGMAATPDSVMRYCNPMPADALEMQIKEEGLFAENMAYTVLNRLGSHGTHRFRAEHTNTKTDFFKHIDIALYFPAIGNHGQGVEGFMFGLDVTISDLAQSLWDKHLELNDPWKPERRNVQIRPIGSKQQYSGFADSVRIPREIVQGVMERWEKCDRSRILQTPDLLLAPGEIHDIAQRLLRHVVDLRNKPVYNEQAITGLVNSAYPGSRKRP